MMILTELSRLQKGFRLKMKLLDISIILIVCCFCVGCNEQAKSSSTEPESNKKQSQVKTVNALSEDNIGNDIERLSRITDKINHACRGAYIVVLGADESAGSNMIAVDYQLFDSLSDDAVVVMIAEKIASRRMQVKEADITERQILQIDELSGRIVASAGFKQSGFNQWLEKDSVTNQIVPQKSRLEAFMRGYQKK